MRRGHYGFLKVDARAGAGGALFDMHFYDPDKDDWYRDASVSCMGEPGSPPRVHCPWLPASDAAPACPPS